jgi:hypothetical protein
LDQFIVTATFDYTAFVDDKNSVRAPDGRKAVGDNDDGHAISPFRRWLIMIGRLSSGQHVINRLLNQVFTLGVERTSCFIDW